MTCLRALVDSWNGRSKMAVEAASAGKEAVMPIYEYTCGECGKSFSQILTLKEHESGEVVCPACTSKNVEQKPAGFYAVTSKKS